MGQIQIVRPSSDATIKPLQQATVLTKAAWADDWVVEPYLEPLTSSIVVAPAVSQATFLYRYGSIKREDSSSYADTKPLNLAGRFCKIEVVNEFGEWNSWVGFFDAETYDVHGAYDTTSPRGDLSVTAFGLEHLLDRRAIQGARVDQGGSVAYVDRAPAFNRKHRHGLQTQGNRTTSVAGDGVHVFSADGAAWTHKDIIEYMLQYYGPTNVTFSLDGQQDLLDSLTGVYDFDGLTLKQVLDKLIDRSRGLGYAINTSGDGTAYIYVFSVLGEDITFGDYTLAGNKRQVEMELDTAIDVELARVMINKSSRYDKVVVQGAPIVSCFSVSYADSTLEQGWAAAEETSYRVGDPAASTWEKNDAFRQEKELERVFQFYRIPSTWDWQAGDGVGGTQAIVNPTIRDDGTVDTSVQGSYFNSGKALLRTIPIEKTTSASNTETEYLPPLVFLLDEDTDSETYGKYLDASKRAGKALPMKIRTVDREMAIEVEPSINHYLGLNHFNPPQGGSDGDAAKVPIYDWQSMVCTVAMETDQRSLCIVYSEEYNGLDNPRTHIIPVDDAEFWYIAPNTITSTSSGVLQKHAGGTLRSDYSRLQAIATFAKAWYCEDRATIDVRLKTIGEYAAVGSYVRTISASWQKVQVGTVVTSRQHDYKRGTTAIKTDYQGLNVKSAGSAADAFPGMSDARAVSRAFKKLEHRVEDLEKRTGNLPVSSAKDADPDLYGHLYRNDTYMNLSDQWTGVPQLASPHSGDAIMYVQNGQPGYTPSNLPVLNVGMGDNGMNGYKYRGPVAFGNYWYPGTLVLVEYNADISGAMTTFHDWNGNPCINGREIVRGDDLTVSGVFNQSHYLIINYNGTDYRLPLQTNP